MTIFLALFIRSNSAAASLLTAVPPLPGPPPAPLFLLRSELKKLAKTPSLAAPPGPGLPPSTYRYKNTEHTLKPVAHPGVGGHGAQATPSFLDQTEARTAGKKVLETAPSPASLRVWMTGPPLPPSLSQGLDLALKTGINGLVNWRSYMWWATFDSCWENSAFSFQAACVTLWFKIDHHTFIVIMFVENPIWCCARRVDGVLTGFSFPKQN